MVLFSSLDICTVVKASPESLKREAVSKLPLEPTLLPKVQVQSGDFPYLHYSIRSGVYNSGDLMRNRVRI